MENNVTGQAGANSGINAFVLKIIAITAMVCDHASVVFMPGQFTLLRVIGRLGFPIFAFMIAQGAAKTRSIPKYMLRLLVFGVISEIPFDFVLFSEGKNPFDFGGTNVYFTLLAGLFAIYCIRTFKEKYRALIPAGIILSLLFAWAVNTDYSVPGTVCIILFYLFSSCKKPMKIFGYTLAVISVCLTFATLPDCLEAAGANSLPLTDVLKKIPATLTVNPLELPAFLSLPFIILYNGEKGANFNKYFFYAFYPGHIVVLYLISLLFLR